MAKLVTGLFNARSSAMLAIEDLMRHGVAQEDISLLLTDTSRGREFFAEMHSKAPEGAMLGTILGAIIGGVLAYLVSAGYINDQGLGLATLRPLFAVLSGVGAGSLIGLIIGGLIGLAMPEYEFNLDRADKRKSGLLVGVYCHAKREGEVRRLLEAAGGRQIKTKGVRDERLPEVSRQYVPANDIEARG